MKRLINTFVKKKEKKTYLFLYYLCWEFVFVGGLKKQIQIACLLIQVKCGEGWFMWKYSNEFWDGALYNYCVGGIRHLVILIDQFHEFSWGYRLRSSSKNFV